MSISKKGPKKGNDAVASRLADFTGEKEVPIAGHNKMSGSQEQDETYSGSELDPSVEELANSLEGAALGDSSKVFFHFVNLIFNLDQQNRALEAATITLRYSYSLNVSLRQAGPRSAIGRASDS